MLGRGCTPGTLLGLAHHSSRVDCLFMIPSQRSPGVLCILTLSPGLVVTHLKTCQIDDNQCCLHNVYICVCPPQSGQASLTETSHVHGLLLELHVFALFLIRTYVFERILEHRHAQAFSALLKYVGRDRKPEFIWFHSRKQPE